MSLAFLRHPGPALGGPQCGGGEGVPKETYSWLLGDHSAFGYEGLS